jgi:long-chain acyl-CoA synthetase
MTNESTERTLPRLLTRSADLNPDRESLSFYDGAKLSYRQLKDSIDHIAAFLAERGIVHGDRVAILSENSPHWGIAYFAVVSIGAIAVPVLADFHPTEVHHVLRHSEAKAVFVSDRYYAKIEDTHFDHLKLRILIDDFSVIDPHTSKSGLKKLLADGEQELKRIKILALKWAGRIPTRVREEDAAAIIYTSGTMGHTKGVLLTHRNLVSNALATGELAALDCRDRLLSLLPLAHVYECTLGLITPLLMGASVAYVHKPPTAAVLLPALAAVRPTIVLAVPLLIEKMVRSKVWPEIRSKKILNLACKVPTLRKKVHRIAGKRLLETFGGSLRLLCIGGAGLAPDVEAFLREAGFPYSIGYGLTETSPLVAGTNAAETRFRSTGKALRGIEIRIDGPDPKTGEGEILVRGDSVMKGYYRDPERTAEILSEDGWLRTGDLGCFDADAFLYIKGRLKNVILGPSGENIYPEVIESVINRSEEVLESLVFETGGRLAAKIHLDYDRLGAYAAEKKLDETQVREHIGRVLEEIKHRVNESVASFSRLSRVIEQHDPFEKTPTQKIKRFLYIEAAPADSV